MNGNISITFSKKNLFMLFVIALSAYLFFGTTIISQAAEAISFKISSTQTKTVSSDGKLVFKEGEQTVTIDSDDIKNLAKGLNYVQTKVDSDVSDAVDDLKKLDAKYVWTGNATSGYTLTVTTPAPADAP